MDGYIFILAFLATFHAIYSLSGPVVKSFLRTRVLPVLMLAAAFGEAVLAQPGTGTIGGPGAGAGATAISLDGGVLLLPAGGVACGIRHLRNRRRKT